MSSPETRTGQDAKLLMAAGLALWLVAGGASVWELLALQAPESPLHLGVLAGPIVQLRNYAFGLGSVLAVAAWSWPSLFPEDRGRWVLGLLLVGSVAHTLVLGVAATRGLLAVQIFDPRDDVRLMLYARAFGHALTLLAGLAMLSRAVQRLLHRPGDGEG